MKEQHPSLKHSPQDNFNITKCIICGHKCHCGDGPCSIKDCNCDRCFHSLEHKERIDNLS